MTIKRVGRFVSRYLYAAAACLYLLTIGLLSARNRSFLYMICARFGYQPVKTLIPQVKLSDIIPPDTEIEIHEPLGVDGSVSLAELAAICSLIQHHRPDRLMEIGTLDGRTTLNMAANSAPSAQVYTLDLPGQPSGACFLGKALSAKITQLHGDSTTFDFSPFYNSLDFVFIDANHACDYVLSDSRQAIRLLRDGWGVIVWHDYDTWDWEGTTHALNHLYSTDKEDIIGNKNFVYTVYSCDNSLRGSRQCSRTIRLRTSPGSCWL